MISRKLSIAMTAALLVAAAATTHAAEDGTVETTDAAAAAPAPASEEASPFGGKAPYFMGGGVWGIENVDGVPGGVSDSGGYDIRAGYDVHEMVALEIEWQSLLSFKRSSQDPVTGIDDPALEARMLSFNTKFSPFVWRFQPYVMAGMGWVNVQADRSNNKEHKSSFGMRFGIGVQTFFTQRFGFNLEAGYILPLSGDLGGGQSFDLIPITASLFFKFM